jgi:hypothetical protein
VTPPPAHAAIVDEGAVACGRISFKERHAGGSPLAVLPLFVKVVRLPAVALLVKIMSPKNPPPCVTKFWMILELFTIPAPLRVSAPVVPLLAVIVLGGGGRGEDNAIDFRIRRNRDVGGI